MNINRDMVARAMMKAGEEPITDTEWEDNKSVRVRLIRSYYLATILETLSTTAWTSRKARQALEQVENTTSAYLYKYKLPDDCAKTVALVSESEYLVEGKSLYTNDAAAELVYVSNGYTGRLKYEVAAVSSQEEFESGEFYVYDAEADEYTRATTYDSSVTYYKVVSEDYPLYDDIEFDPLLSEYLETRLASKVAMKLTGKMELYNTLYRECLMMENRAIRASEAHGHNKDKGHQYWGEILGMPEY